MSDPNNTSIPAHPLGQTPGVRAAYLWRAPAVQKCETVLHVGVFFDGTGNNMEKDKPVWKDSNVARLFRSYPDEPYMGYYPAYVPGVGTRFPEIGEEEPLSSGAGFGAGGDGRINFGLLHVINSIHRSVSPSDRPYAPPDTVKALCRNGRRTRTSAGRGGETRLSPLATVADESALRRVGMDERGGLLLDNAAQAPQRAAFFRRACTRIAQQIAQIDKPKPIELFIDVFGFSRGATEARTFCNWLLEMFEGDTLCGVPASIRFLGLFDTVASVGLPASAGSPFDGHASWADTPYLRIAPQVKNCVHFVAMHENRGSFPSELVRREGVLPANCQEFMFPGMHSDVGGGYGPGDQGRGPGKKDEEKLSQLPLQVMYDAAKVAKVPLEKALARDGAYDPFKIAPNVRQAFETFMSARQKSQPVREWLVEYLAWRYQVRHHYNSLPWHARATNEDKANLQGANQRLLDDVDALRGLEQTAGRSLDPDSPEGREQARQRARVRSLEREAAEVYARVKAAPPTDAATAALFADFVHDSYAGFRPFDQLKLWGWDPVPGSWEGEGYLRWRRRYEGTDERFTRNTEPRLEAMPA